MLEGLCTRILQTLLSKYIQDDDDDDDEHLDDQERRDHRQSRQRARRPERASSSSNRRRQRQQQATTLGVWSGYVIWHDLRLKTGPVNEYFQAKGHAIEMVHGTLGKVELTVPWSQLPLFGTNSPTSRSSTRRRSSTPANSTTPNTSPVVVVIDGVYILLRTLSSSEASSSTSSWRQAKIRQRRQALAEAIHDLEEQATAPPNQQQQQNQPDSSWKEWIKQRLMQGSWLPWVVDGMQIHIRNVHVRLEQAVPRPPHDPSPSSEAFCAGIVLESMHLQRDVLMVNAPEEGATKDTLPRVDSQNLHDQRGDDVRPSLIHKVAYWNRLGVYWNPMVATPGALEHVPTVNQAWQHWNARAVMEALDRSIVKRAVPGVTESQVHAPPLPSLQHSFCIVPMDGRINLTLSTDPRNLSPRRPALHAIITLCEQDTMGIQIRDYQVWQMLHWWDSMQEYKYKLHFRKFRPKGAVRDDPRAWWIYAVEVIQYQLKKHRLRWSWGRFHRRFQLRQRYCELYESFLLAANGDDAAGPGPVVLTAHPSAETILAGRPPRHLSEKDRLELQEFDDGLRDDFSIQDIILFRILVHRRLGLPLTAMHLPGTSWTAPPRRQQVGRSPVERRYSWFGRTVRRLVASDYEAEQEFDRLLTYWQAWSDEVNDVAGAEDSERQAQLKLCPAIIVDFTIETTLLTTFSPLQSTKDQVQMRRLQEKFLEFTLANFHISFNIMGDYETYTLSVESTDFGIREIRSNRDQYTVVARANKQEQTSPPLVVVAVTKCGQSVARADVTFLARVQATKINLEPGCEWMGRLRNLAGPLPQFQRLSQFWRGLSWDYINSWTSGELAWRIKTEMASSEHMSVEVDICVDCPIVSISSGDGSTLIVDPGRAFLKTHKLALVASSGLESVKSQVMSQSEAVDHNILRNEGEPEYSKEMMRLKPWNDSGFFRNMIDASVDLAASVRFDESGSFAGRLTEMGRTSVLFEENATIVGSVDSVFYDVYSLIVHTGGITFAEHSGTSTIAGNISFHAVIQRTVIPSDQTVCPLKVDCELEPVLLSLSAAHLLLFKTLWKNWRDESTVPLVEYELKPTIPFDIREMEEVEAQNRELENVDSGSAFDEDEFFDATENDFYALECTSMNEDNDAFSAVDADSRWLNGRVRQKKRRQRSASDISSLSEASLSRKRENFDHGYLNEENLARLEEEVGEDQEVEDLSFHSAMSLRALVELEKELDQQIERVESSARELKSKIAEIRRVDRSNDASVRIQGLRLDLEKLSTELKAFRAARVDLRAEAEKLDSDDIVGRSASEIARRVGCLVVLGRKRDGGEVLYQAGIHPIRQGDILRFSLRAQTLALHITSSDDSAEYSSLDVTIGLDLSKFGVTLVKGASSLKVHSTLDSLSCYVADHKERTYLLMGGHDEIGEAGIIPEQISNVISPLLNRDKLLKAYVELSQATKESTPRINVKCTMVASEIGLFPCWTKLDPVASFFVRLLALKLQDIKENSYPDQRKQVDRSQLGSMRPKSTEMYCDFQLRVAAVRCMFVNKLSEPSGLVTVGELNVRFACASKQIVYKDRYKIDIHCNSIQVLSFEIFETGECCEIFSSHEGIGPFLKIRHRGQLVPQNDHRGWVFDIVPGEVDSLGGFKGSLNEDPECQAWNSYVFLKLEPVSVLVIPDQIRRVFDVISAAKTFVGKFETKRSVVGQKAAKSGERRCLVPTVWRWRIDLSMKDVTLRFRPGVGSNFDRHELIAGISSSMSTQRSLEMKNVWLIDGDVCMSSLAQAEDGLRVMENVQANVSCEIQLLSPPRDNQWDPAEVVVETTFDIVFDFAPIKCSLYPSVLVSLVTFRTALIPISDRGSGTSMKLSSKSSQVPSRITVKCNAVKFALELFQDVKWFKRANPFAVMSMEAILSSFIKSSNSTILDIRLDGVKMVDSSKGATILVLDCNAEKKVPSVKLAMARFQEQNHRTLLSIELARVQLLVLPSVVQSLVDFAKCIKSSIIESPSTSPLMRSIVATLSTHRMISLHLGVEHYELVIPSKDVPKMLREEAQEPIGLIIIRQRFDFKASVTILFREELEKTLTPCKEESHNSFSDLFQNRSVDSLRHSIQANCELCVTDCQVVRSTLHRMDKKPCSLFHPRPSPNEQRITNAFTYAITHKLVAPCFIVEGTSRTYLNQAAQLRAEFVDVLIYFARSSSGINESLRVSIRPIQAIFAKPDYQDSDTKRRKVLEKALSVTTILSLRTEGIQMTLVPGGATRLTESPIMKVSLFRVSSGLAASPVENDLRFQAAAERALDGAILSLWLNCELSGSYHNRRLVTWEPFIEPWRLQMRFGADITQGLNRSPALESSPGRRGTGFGSENAGAGRMLDLRHISKLLVSKFQTERLPTTNDGKYDDALIYSNGDFAYLLLLSEADSIVSDTVFPAVTDAPKDSLKPALPHSETISWASQFGFPSNTILDNSSVEKCPALHLSITDYDSLNFNLTGALINSISEHLKLRESNESHRLAPHRIRNESGLTIRFHEALETERVDRGEKPSKVILTNGLEAPLMLKRSISQSCDPHRAFLFLELGNFEDTVGRFTNAEYTADVKGSRSSKYVYKVTSKVGVDTVGVHRYPLDWNTLKKPQMQGASADLGWIIVRVELKGGLKLVTVESPVALKNSTDVDLLYEVRDRTGIALMWRCILPSGTVLPVPSDIAPFIHRKSYYTSVIALPTTRRFQHESDIQAMVEGSTRIRFPAPYSRTSVGQGLIEESSITLEVLDNASTLKGSTSDLLHLNVCSLRMGTFVPEKTLANTAFADIPEQRMLLFRPPLLFVNCLPFPVVLFVRRGSTSNVPSDSDGEPENDWAQIGHLGCGGVCGYTRSMRSEATFIRVRICESDGSVSSHFPRWSDSIVIPPQKSERIITDTPADSTSELGALKILDNSGVRLSVHVTLTRATSTKPWNSGSDSIRQYAANLVPGARVANLHIPFWVIDETGLDLQYRSGSLLAGQDALKRSAMSADDVSTSNTWGLRELLENDGIGCLPSRPFFRVLMISDENATRLQVRCRMSLRHGKRNCFSPWSDPISLAKKNRGFSDINILPATIEGGDMLEPYALRSRIVAAPLKQGGFHGTRLIHIVCRYAVVNELGREIEINAGANSDKVSFVLRGDSEPVQFHLDDSGPIRFRPREYGWAWSGRFNLRRRKDTTLRLRHRIKGLEIIVNVEYRSKREAATCVVLFRPATYAPYRLENRTLFPLEYFQHTTILAVEGNLADNHDSVILPYHDGQFAWDDPEYGAHVLSVRVADFGDIPKEIRGKRLGSFRIDSLTPGTEIMVSSMNFLAMVLADGPTLVLRFCEVDAKGNDQPLHKMQELTMPWLSVSISAELTHGIGISLIDWNPQELVHLQVEEIICQLSREQQKESGSIVFGRIVVDNQLWVTPYPVFLTMGSSVTRRRRKRHNAISLSWIRSLEKQHRDIVLFEKAELTFEPSILTVDGNLISLALNMLNQTRDRAVIGSTKRTRNDELRRALGMDRRVRPVFGRAGDSAIDETYALTDTTLTAALAAKLKSRYLPADQIARKVEHSVSGLIGTPPRKIYVEKLRISSITGEVSWSGSLPIALALPIFMRPALTFEGLPLLLRPYSVSHAFGTMQEHLSSMRSHYLSFWRVADLFLGVVTRPTFIVRAFVFTWRESLANAFQNCVSGLQMATRAIDVVTLNDETMSKKNSLPEPVRALLRGVSTVLSSASRLTLSTSSLLRFSGASKYQGGLVRTRNPRLFANIDGKDLLVEYLEGENAGKALLSRVKMGAFSSEGYLFHVEGARLIRHEDMIDRSDEIAPERFILMVTFDRILLLHGELDVNFCQIAWESPLRDVVLVDTCEVLAYTGLVDLEVWYLLSSSRKSTRLDDMPSRRATSFGLSHGLEALQRRSILIPRSAIKTVLEKLSSVNRKVMALE